MNKSIQFTSFYLAYSKKTKLPFDDNTEIEIILNDRVKELSINLIQAKKKTIENIKKSQSNQKKYHDRKIKRKLNLNIENKVLFYDVAKVAINLKRNEKNYIISITSYSIDLINSKISKEI